MGARVQTITIKAGDMTFMIYPIETFGDNPAFFSQQVDDQLDAMKEKARKTFEAYYGRQVA